MLKYRYYFGYRSKIETVIKLEREDYHLGLQKQAFH